MDVHLPKPLHGWRQFVGEIGVIVLGVLIALGSEQWVENWQWQREVAEVRAALADEVSENAANAIERRMVNVCLRARLAALLGALESGSATWKGNADQLNYRTYVEDFRDFPTVYRAPYLHWPSDVWDSAKANGIVNHMGRKEVIRLSQLYSTFDRMRDLQDREQDLFPALLNLGFDDHLDPPARRQAVALIGRLHWANQVILEEADRVPAQLDDLQDSLGRLDLREEAQARAKKQRDFRGNCVQPLRLDD